MTNWKEYKLSDFAEINPKIALKKGVEYSFVEMKDLSEGNKFVTPSQKKELKGGSRFENGDTLFARITPCLQNGKICEVKELENGKGFGSTEFLVFRGKEGVSDSKFVHYLSLSNEVRSFAEQNMVGTSGRQRVSWQAFENLVLSLPDLPTQTAIAEILSSLDDKIELNNKINQELENLAQTLFKQWFIDFEFPNQNGDPYKSSGGEMIDSELGEIPKGWEVGIFGEICKLSTGKGIKKKDYLFDGSYPVIGANGVMGFYDKFNTEGFKILTGRVGTLGTVRINTEKVWTSDNVIVCSPKSEELDHFAYYVLSSFNFEALNRGSTQPLLTQTDLKSQVIIIPSFNVLKTFNFQLDSQYSIVSNNKNENQELTNLRDTLLPKLISGELEVNGLNRDSLDLHDAKDFKNQGNQVNPQNQGSDIKSLNK